MSKKKAIESLALQVACLKAYIELMVPCMEAMAKSLDKLLGDILGEVHGANE